MPDETSIVETFLFIGLDGRRPAADAMSEGPDSAAEARDRTIRGAIELHSGHIFMSGAGGYRAVFSDPILAVQAAMEAQIALQNASLSDPKYSPGQGRFAIHSGIPERYKEIFLGSPIATAAALVSAAHGGQIVMSDTTCRLLGDSVPERASLSELGRHGLEGVHGPVRIWQLGHPALESRFPPLKTRDLARTNIPSQPNEFIGRKGDITRLRALLRSNRTVSIVGEAGVGKTRLACQVGLAELDRRPNGVWYVGLGPVSDMEQTIAAIATVFRIRQAPGISAMRSLTAALRERRLLLILDQCDHLRTVCVRIARAIIRNCPGVDLLITARETLRADSERCYPLMPLGLPPPREEVEEIPTYSLVRHEAVRLFMNRARALRADFGITASTAAASSRLCHLLGGNPLAIELAAAHAHVLSAEQMADALGSVQDHHGLDWSAGEAERLGAVITWSYGLLSTAEKTIMLRLSVFSGGWELAEAEMICADDDRSLHGERPRLSVSDVAAVVRRLAQRGMVSVLDDRHVRTYFLAPPIQQFCRNRRRRLADDDRLRARHSEYFCSLACAASAAVSPLDRRSAEDHVARALYNLRAALREAFDQATLPAKVAEEGAIAKLLLTLSATADAWISGCAVHEGSRMLERALALPGARDSRVPTATALLAQARLSRMQGRRPTALKLVDEAAGLFASASDSAGQAMCYELMAALARDAGHVARARSHANHALPLVSGARRTEAAAIELAGELAWTDHDPLSALTDESDAIHLRRWDRHDWTAAQALVTMGGSAYDRGNLTACRAFLDEALDLWQRLMDRERMEATQEMLAIVARAESGEAHVPTVFLEA